MPRIVYGMGVAVGDYDNDGFADIYVTGYGANTLYHNNGNGTFTDVTARAGVRAAGGAPAPASSTTTTTASSISSSDATWNGLSRPTAIAARPSRVGAPTVTPTISRAIANILYHNNGDGTFTDVSMKSGVANAEGQDARRGFRRLSTGMAGPTFCRQRFGAVLSLPQQPGRHVHGGVAAGRRRVQRGRRNVCGHGHRFRRL